MPVQQTSEDSATLPSTNAELSHVLDAGELTAIGSPDSIYASVNNTLGYGIMQFEYDATGKTSLVVTWQDGKADIAPSSSPVKLQIYKVAAPAGWEDLDSNSAAAAGATFTLTGTKAVLTDYVDGSNIVYVRVYQATSVGPVLIAGYDQTHYNWDNSMYAGEFDSSGQAFDMRAVTGNYVLTTVEFYINSGGSPPGNCYAALYAMTGTLGTNGKPTGTAIATSDSMLAIDIGTSKRWVSFTFSGSVESRTLTNGNNYCISLEYNNGDIGNLVSFGGDNGGDLADPGNFFRGLSGSYTGYSNADSCYKVYGTPA